MWGSLFEHFFPILSVVFFFSFRVSIAAAKVNYIPLAFIFHYSKMIHSVYLLLFYNKAYWVHTFPAMRVHSHIEICKLLGLYFCMVLGSEKWNIYGISKQECHSYQQWQPSTVSW